MGMDGTVLAAAGKRVLALGLLLGALIVVALLLGTGSAQAHEKGLGDTLGVHLQGGPQHAGHHAASPGHHAHRKATAGRTAAAHPARHTPRHAVRNTLAQVAGSQPVRRSLAPLTQSTTPRSEPAQRSAATPVRDTVKAAVNTVRATQPVKHVQDATLLIAKTVGDVRRTTQQLTGQVLPTLPPPGLPGVPVPPASGPDGDHPAAGSPQATDAFDSAAVTAPSGGIDAPAAVQPKGAAGSQSDTVSPGPFAIIGTAVSALRDMPSLPSPALPGPPHQDSGASSSVALFAGMLGAALLLSLMSGLARLRSRRFRLVPNPTYRPSSSPD